MMRTTPILSPQGSAAQEDPLHRSSGQYCLAKATDQAAKAQQHAAARPVAATPSRHATENTQAAPLGLKGDTVKKQPKPKREKGAPKERLQEKPKPVDTSTPVAPTVNPALGGSAVPATAPAQPATDSGKTPPATTPQTPPATPTQHRRCNSCLINRTRRLHAFAFALNACTDRG